MKFTAKEFKRSIAAILAFTMAFSSPVSTLADYNAAEMLAAEYVYADSVNAPEAEPAAETVSGVEELAGDAEAMEAAEAVEADPADLSAESDAAKGGTDENFGSDAVNGGAADSEAFTSRDADGMETIYGEGLSAELLAAGSTDYVEVVFLDDNKQTRLPVRAYALKGYPLTNPGVFSKGDLALKGWKNLENDEDWNIVTQVVPKDPSLTVLTLYAVYDEPTADVDGKTYGGLQLALADGAKKASARVTLLRDVTDVNETLLINDRGLFTLDLNGHVISGNHKVSGKSPDNSLIKIDNSYQMTIIDSSADKTGRIENTCTDDPAAVTIHVTRGGFDLGSGEIKGENCAVRFEENSGSFSMSGGRLTAAKKDGTAISFHNTDQWISVRGGVFTGKVDMTLGKRTDIGFTGGSFDRAPDESLLKDSIVQYGSDAQAPYEVVPKETAEECELKVIRGGREVWFKSLVDAVSQDGSRNLYLESGDILELQKDVTLTTDNYLRFRDKDRNGNDVSGYTFRLNGHSLQASYGCNAFCVGGIDFTLEGPGQVDVPAYYPALFVVPRTTYSAQDRSRITITKGAEVRARTGYAVANNADAKSGRIDLVVSDDDVVLAGGSSAICITHADGDTVTIGGGWYEGTLLEDFPEGEMTWNITGGHYTVLPEQEKAAEGYGFFEITEEEKTELPERFKDHIYICDRAVKVSFDLNGEEGTAPETQEIRIGTKAGRPADPVSPTKFFGGWYTDRECTAVWNFDTDTAEEDTTLYAKWGEAAAVIYRGGEPVEKYSDLFTAVKASKSGDTIKMLKDWQGNSIDYFSFKQLTLDMNGCSITGNSYGGVLHCLKSGLTIINNSGKESVIYNRSTDPLASAVHYPQAGDGMYSANKYLRISNVTLKASRALSAPAEGVHVTVNNCKLIGLGEKFVALRIARQYAYVTLKDCLLDGMIDTHEAEVVTPFTFEGDNRFSVPVNGKVIPEGYGSFKDGTGDYPYVIGEGYKVSFDVMGADLEVPAMRFARKNGLIEDFPQIADSEECMILGWYTEKELENLWHPETDTVSADMTLYLGWAKPEAMIVRNGGTEQEQKIYAEKLLDTSNAGSGKEEKKAKSGDRIVLLKDVTLPDGDQYRLTRLDGDTKNPEFTLDLNGHTLTAATGYLLEPINAKLTVTGPGAVTSTTNAAIGAGGSWSQRDPVVAEVIITGEAQITGKDNAVYLNAYDTYQTVKLTVESGTLRASQPEGGNSVYLTGQHIFVNITGGTFEDGFHLESPNAPQGDLITGGTFAVHPGDSLLAEGVSMALDADGKLIPVAGNPAAKVYDAGGNDKNSYRFLQDAFSAAENGGKVKLLRDVDGDLDVSAAEGRMALVIDGKGQEKKVTFDLDGYLFTDAKICAKDSAQVTVENACVLGTGDDFLGTEGANASLYVKNGLFNRKVKDQFLAEDSVCTENADPQTKSVYSWQVLETGGKNVAELNADGTIKKLYNGFGDAFLSAASGSTIKVLRDFYEYGPVTAANVLTLDLAGHTVRSSDPYSAVLGISSSSLQITVVSTGGTGRICSYQNILSKNAVSVQEGKLILADKNVQIVGMIARGDHGNIEISDGTYICSDPETSLGKNLAADCVYVKDPAVDPDHGYHIEKGYVRRVRAGVTAYFDDLKTAFASAQAGDRFYVCRDLELAEPALLSGVDGMVTLDLQGSTLSGCAKKEQLISVDNADLTVKNGTIDTTAVRGIYLWNGTAKVHALTLDNVTVTAKERAVETYGYTPNMVDLSVRNCRLSAEAYSLYPQMGCNELNVSSGFFDGKVYASGTPKLKGGFTGGSFTVKPLASLAASGYWVYDAGETDPQYQKYPYVIDKRITVEYYSDGRFYKDQILRRGKTLTKPADPTRQKYVFGGWWTRDGKDGDWGTQWNFADPVSGDMRLYAKWTADTRTVTFDLNGHGSVCPAPQKVFVGEKAEKPADPVDAPDFGFAFKGWYTEGGDAWDFSKDVVTEDMTLRAKWLSADVTIVKDGKKIRALANEAGPGETLQDAVNTVTAGESICLEKDIEDCFRIILWYRSAVIDLNGHSIHAKADDVDALFTVRGCTLELMNTSTSGAVITSARAYGVEIMNDGVGTFRIPEGSEGTITVSGGEYAVWSGSKENNITIADGRFAGGTGSLSCEDGPVEQGRGNVTGGIFSHKFDESFLAEGLMIVNNEDAETKAAYPFMVGSGYVVTFDVSGHGQAPEAQKVPAGGLVTKVTPAPVTEVDVTYVFNSWWLKKTDETTGEPVWDREWDFETDTVSADTTLYAKWDTAEAFFEEYDLAGDVPETHEKIPYASLKQAMAAVNASEKQYAVVTMAADLQMASPSVVQREEGKTFVFDLAGKYVSCTEEGALFTIENTDAKVLDSSAPESGETAGSGILINTLTEGDACLFKLTASDGKSHAFTAESGWLAAQSVIIADENYKKVSTGGNAWLFASGGDVVRFSDPAMALDIRAGHISGAIRYAGTGDLALSAKITGGYFDRMPDREFLAAGYGPVELAEPIMSIFFYEVQRARYVTFDLNGMTDGTVIPAQYVPVGGKVTKPADPEWEGHIFNGWKNGDVFWDFDTVIAEDSVENDLVLTASWTENKVKLTPAAGGDPVIYGSVAAALQAAAVGDTITLLADCVEDVLTVKKNVTLDLGGFRLSLSEETNSFTLLEVTNDAELTITDGSAEGITGKIAAEGRCAIAANSQNAQVTMTADIPVTGTVMYNKAAAGGAQHTLPAKDHGLMAGLYTAEPDAAVLPAGYLTRPNTDPLTQDEYPYTIQHCLVVSFDVAGRGEAPETQYVLHGGLAMQPADRDPYEETGVHWLFDGWWTKKDDGTGTGTLTWDQKWNFKTQIVTENVTLYARWIPAAASLAWTGPAAGEDPAEIKTEYFLTLEEAAEALAKKQSDCTVTLLSDIAADHQIALNIQQPFTLTIDLNGHALTGAVAPEAASETKEAVYGLLLIRNGAVLTDGSAAHTGKIENTAGPAVWYHVPMAGGMPELKVFAGTYTGKTGAVPAAYGDAVIVDDKDAWFEITGGNFGGKAGYAQGITGGNGHVSGGLYTVKPEETFLPEGYQVTDLGEGQTYRYKVEKKRFTVKFDLAGGTLTPEPQPQTVAYGEKVTDPGVPAKDNFTFDGWYTGTQPAPGQPIPVTTRRWDMAADVVTANVDLYAWWAQNVAEVSYPVTSQGGTTTETKTFTSLAAAAAEAGAHENVTFRLLSSVTLGETLNFEATVPAEAPALSLTVDFNGKTLAAPGSEEQPGFPAVTVTGAGTVEFEDNTSGALGGISAGTTAIHLAGTGEGQTMKSPVVTVVSGRYAGAFTAGAGISFVKVQGGRFDRDHDDDAALVGASCFIYEENAEPYPYRPGNSAADFTQDGKTLHFTTFPEAVNYINGHGSGALTLQKSYGTTAEPCDAIEFRQGVTIDLNGYDIIGKGTIKEGEKDVPHAVITVTGGDLKVTDSQNRGTVEAVPKDKKYELPVIAMTGSRQHLQLERGDFGGKISASADCIGEITGGRYTEKNGYLAEGYVFRETQSESFRFQAERQFFTLTFHPNGGKFKEMDDKDKPRTTSIEYGRTVNDSIYLAERDGYALDRWTYNNGTEIGTWDPYAPVKKEYGDITAQWLPYVAAIGDTQYTSVQAAVYAASGGATVKLLANVKESVTVTDKKLILDMNGHSITANGSQALSVNNANVTVNGGSLVNTSTAENTSAVTMSGGELTVNGSTVTGGYDGIVSDPAKNSTLNLNDANVTGSGNNGIGGGKFGSSSNGSFTQNIKGKSTVTGKKNGIDVRKWTGDQKAKISANSVGDNSPKISGDVGINGGNMLLDIANTVITALGGTAIAAGAGTKGTIKASTLVGILVGIPAALFFVTCSVKILKGVASLIKDFIEWLKHHDNDHKHPTDVKVRVSFYDGGKLYDYQDGTPGFISHTPDPPKDKKDESFYGWKENAPEVAPAPAFTSITIIAPTEFESVYKKKLKVEFNTTLTDPVTHLPVPTAVADPPTQTVNYGAKATEPSRVEPGAQLVPVDANYQYKGWKDTATGQQYDFNTPVTENKKLDVMWKDVASVSVKGTVAGVSQTVFTAKYRSLNEALIAANTIEAVLQTLLIDMPVDAVVTVKLLEDITDTLHKRYTNVSGGVPVAGIGYDTYTVLRDITLDLGGKKLTETTANAQALLPLITVGSTVAKCTLTVTDSASAGGGAIVMEKVQPAVKVNSGSKLTVKKGKISGSSVVVQMENGSPASHTVLGVSGGEIRAGEVRGGVIVDPGCVAVVAGNYPDITVEGGDVHALLYAIYADTSTVVNLTVKGGYVRTEGSGDARVVRVTNGGAEGRLSGGVSGGHIFGPMEFDSENKEKFTLTGGFYSDSAKASLKDRPDIMPANYGWQSSPEEEKTLGYPHTVGPLREFTVRFDANGGIPDPFSFEIREGKLQPKDQKIIEGQKAVQPYVYKANNELEGWFTKDGSETDPATGEPDWGKEWNFSDPVTDEDVDEDLILKLFAKWKEIKDPVAKVVYADGSPEEKFTELGAAFLSASHDGDSVIMLKDYTVEVKEEEGDIDDDDDGDAGNIGDDGEFYDEFDHTAMTHCITFDLAGFKVDGEVPEDHEGLIVVTAGGMGSRIVDSKLTGSLESTTARPAVFAEGDVEISNAEILHDLSEGVVIGGRAAQQGADLPVVTVSTAYTRIKGHLADENVEFRLSAGKYEEKPAERHIVSGYLAAKNTDKDTLAKGYEWMIVRNKGKVRILVTGSEFFVNGSRQKSYYLTEVDCGTQITLSYHGDAEDFLYWANDSRVVLSDQTNYTFTVTDNVTIECVSNDVSPAGEANILFVNEGNILSGGYYHVEDGHVVDAAGSRIVYPDAPVPDDGREFTGWSMSEDDLIAAMNGGKRVIAVEAQYTGGQPEDGVVVRVTSGNQANGGATVSNVSGGGYFSVGDVINVHADPADGYVFYGWYIKKSDESTFTPVTGAAARNYSMSYTVEEPVTLKAVFRSTREYRLSVEADQFTVDGVFCRTSYDGTSALKQTCVEFEEKEGIKFRYWVNESRNVVSTDPRYTFMLVADTKLYAVYYDTTDEGSSYVIFRGEYNAILGAKLYKTDEAIEFPTVPVHAGKQFTGWDKTEAEIRELMQTERIITVNAVYEALPGTYRIVIGYEFGTDHDADIRSTEVIPNVPITTSRELKADASITDGEEIYSFQYWKCGGKVVSYSTRYFARCTEDGDVLNLVACYSRSGPVEVLPTVTIRETTAVFEDETGKYKYSSLMYYDVPQNYEILDIVTVYTDQEAYATPQYMGSNYDGTAVRGHKFSLGHNYGDARLNVRKTERKQYWFRSYVTVRRKDANGDEAVETYYSDIDTVSLLEE